MRLRTILMTNFLEAGGEKNDENMILKKHKRATKKKH